MQKYAEVRDLAVKKGKDKQKSKKKKEEERKNGD